MERKKTPVGPFRATRLWNSIINDFCANMPTKRHRWKMKFYDGCFTAGDAIDWLHNYLQKNENYGPWVTRQQAVQLLEKFLQNKVIEVMKGVLPEDKESIEDSNCLFKLAQSSPIRKLRSALNSRSNLGSLTPSPKKKRSSSRGLSVRPLSLNSRLMNLPNFKDDIEPSQKPTRTSSDNESGLKRRNSLFSKDFKPQASKQHRLSAPSLDLQDCSEVTNSLNVYQVEEIWRSTTLNRLQKLLWLSTLDGLLDTKSIIAKYIIHNCTRVSKSGVVVLTDKSEDLPHWVLSAMRCLAHWPQKQDIDLPTYTGFERDVFSTISNYFQNLPDPLIPFNMYTLFIEAFGLQLNDDKSYRDEALKICCLLLPPTSRRKLHLLLKLMSKVEYNGELELSERETKRTVLLQTFSRCILKSNKEVDFDEMYSRDVVAYLVDHFEVILRPSDELKADVEERLNYHRRSQVKYCAPPEPVSHCHKVSVEEYEEEKVSASTRAIGDLLETIITDRDMPSKEKKKKLKLFQKAYPEIYSKRLPTTASEAELFPQKPKIKQPMLKSLSKLKPIR